MIADPSFRDGLSTYPMEPPKRCNSSSAVCSGCVWIWLTHVTLSRLTKPSPQTTPLWRNSHKASTLSGMPITQPSIPNGGVQQQGRDFRDDDPRQRLIVALDVSTAAAAQKIVAAIGDSALTYKVGMQLYTAEGPQIVRDLVTSGRRVFLDLKYHDIPNTVSGAVRAAAQLGATMLTVHASGGGKMLRAAVDAARTAPGLIVIAVTVLTSMEESDLEKIGIRGTVAASVIRLATIALASGCQGVVTSAREAASLRAELGNDFAIVVPGVRPAGR